ncbi:MAG: hypothetical protein AAGD25_01750 [Cyanobacteria bacterium P01_F01_bin.150]
MFSLFSLNPLNAIGSAIHMADVRRWSQTPAAIALTMGWTGDREICAFGSLQFYGLGQSILGQSMASRLFSPVAQECHRFSRNIQAIIDSSIIANGFNIQPSIVQSSEHQDEEELGNKSLGLDYEYLGNPEFKSNPNVDSYSRQLMSGRHRFMPVPG